MSGEPFAYRNWTTGEPDSLNENALNFGEVAGLRVPTWNGIADADSEIRGYVGELSAESTTVGLIQNDSGAADGYTPVFDVEVEGHLRLTTRGDSFTGGTATTGQQERCISLRTAIWHTPISPPTRSSPAWAAGLRSWTGTGISSGRTRYADSTHCQDHDAIWLPGGNVLMIALERRDRDQSIGAGRDSYLLSAASCGPAIWLKSTRPAIALSGNGICGTIWCRTSTRRGRNYGVVAQHPELVDVNCVGNGLQYTNADWIHANALDYNPRLDQVLLCVRNLDEVWVIDHSTMTEQARGHNGGRQGMGGDVLYRWGSPQAYRAGDSSDHKLFEQHSAHWIGPGLPGAGNILLFNNDPGRPTERYSTVVEFDPDCDSSGHYYRPVPGVPYGPEAPCWVYGANPPTSLYSSFFSGAQRLPNGNTLICAGDGGSFREVTRDSRGRLAPCQSRRRHHADDSGRHVGAWSRPPGDPLRPGLSRTDRPRPHPGYPLERYRAPALAIAEPAQPAPPAASRQSWFNPIPTRARPRLHAICPGPQPPAISRERPSV